MIARTDYCDYPPEARQLPSAGSGIRPPVEPVLAFRPDLVVIFAGPDNAASIERLRALGTPVFAIRHNSIEDLEWNLRRLGALVGAAQRADSLARAIRGALDSIARAAASDPRPRVYYDLWGDPPHTIGRGSYLNELIAIAGASNVFGYLEAPSPRINFEAVLAADPDIVITSAEPGVDPVARLRARPGWRALPAVREGRVAAVNPDLVHRLGPRLPQAARELAAAVAEGSGAAARAEAAIP